MLKTPTAKRAKTMDLTIEMSPESQWLMHTQYRLERILAQRKEERESGERHNVWEHQDCRPTNLL